MKIKCKKCSEEVIEGEIKSVEKKNGGRKTIFNTGLNKPKGAILKNNSSNPKKWEGICSKCQATNNTGKVKV